MSEPREPVSPDRSPARDDPPPRRAPADAPPPGTYEHYRGGTYRVLGAARHSETEQWLVVYRALYGEGGLWVRPLAMFVETVTTDDGPRPRFRRVGD